MNINTQTVLLSVLGLVGVTFLFNDWCAPNDVIWISLSQGKQSSFHAVTTGLGTSGERLCREPQTFSYTPSPIGRVLVDSCEILRPNSNACVYNVHKSVIFKDYEVMLLHDAHTEWSMNQPDPSWRLIDGVCRSPDAHQLGMQLNVGGCLILASQTEIMNGESLWVQALPNASNPSIHKRTPIVLCLTPLWLLIAIIWITRRVLLFIEYASKQLNIHVNSFRIRICLPPWVIRISNSKLAFYGIYVASQFQYFVYWCQPLVTWLKRHLTIFGGYLQQFTVCCIGCWARVLCDLPKDALKALGDGLKSESHVCAAPDRIYPMKSYEEHLYGVGCKTCGRRMSAFE